MHPTTVGTDLIHNDALYGLFRPDLENPTREDFEQVVRGVNRLPVASLEPEDVTSTVLHLASDVSRYITGTPAPGSDREGRFGPHPPAARTRRRDAPSR